MITIQSIYDRFCRTRFPLPREGELFALQRRIGIVFPREYRDFILEFNGGYFSDPVISPPDPACPSESLASLFGIGASQDTAELGCPAEIDLFDDNHPPKIVPIGRTALGGLIILDTAPGYENGSIYLKQAWGSFYYLADSIVNFFALLREPPSV